MKNQVLYISYDGMTDQLGQSQVLPYIIELTKKGFHFTLISCEKKEKFEKNKELILKICNENKIDWQPLYYHKWPPVFSTIWDVYAIKQLASKLHRKKNFSLLHCRGYISSLVGLNFKLKFGIKFLFDMRGLWADEKVDAGAWELKNPLYKKVYSFFKKKEKEFLVHSDHIISLTQKGKEELISWNVHESVKNKITVIPCCVDTNLFNPEIVSPSHKLKWMNKLSIDENHQVICYLGSIGTWYMLDEMLDFYMVWRENKSKPKFLFITHEEHDKIIFKAKEKNIADEIILQPATRNEIPTLLSLAQLSVFFIRPTYSKISSSPTKLAEIMAMGIPIICNSGVGDTDKIISQFNAGCLVKEFNSNSYKQIIYNFNTIKFEATEIREKSQLNFDVNVATDIYSKIYNKLINQD
jgi:glycosyltransferase involved in cell wall biosynthesis